MSGKSGINENPPTPTQTELLGALRPELIGVGAGVR